MFYKGIAFLFRMECNRTKRTNFLKSIAYPYSIVDRKVKTDKEKLKNFENGYNNWAAKNKKRIILFS